LAIVFLQAITQVDTDLLAIDCSQTDRVISPPA
jgi:hypothetical protein